MPQTRIIRVGTPGLPTKEKFVQNLQEELKQTLHHIRRRHLARRQLLVISWNGDKPQFHGPIEVTPIKATMTIKLRGGWTDGNKKWLWVNDGTRVRYATMTPDFEAKTARGRFRSGAGKGGVAYVSKKQPRAGIDPRSFDEDIMVIEEKNTERDILAAVGRALDRA